MSLYLFLESKEGTYVGFEKYMKWKNSYRQKGLMCVNRNKLENAFVRPGEQMPLMSTKLYIPHHSMHHLSRERLTAKMSRAAQCKLSVVVAPPGFGKTSMVSEWIRLERIRACWVSLDKGENDVLRFWSYIIAAFDRVEPGIGKRALSLLQSPLHISIEQMVSWLINDLFELKDDIVLILDDYHAIDMEDVHRSVSYMLDRLPRQVHLCLISRKSPPFPLGTLRAKGQLNEVDISELKFTEREIADYWLLQTGSVPNELSLQLLGRRTEGWIAGIQLAALSQMAGRPTVLRQFTGNHRYVADYLLEEVFFRQSEAIQSFLLKTSVLERMNGELCAAVINRTAEEGKRQLLEIEQANLFIVPLDAERYWYRYHHLFADFLRGRLQQQIADEIAGLHERAGVWLERNGFAEEAIEHALSGDDFDRAASLIEGIAATVLKRRETTTLYNWLHRLPQPIAGRPSMLVIRAWTELFMNEHESLSQTIASLRKELDKVQHQNDPRTNTQREELGIVEAYQALFRNDFDRALELVSWFYSRDLADDDTLLIAIGIELNEGVAPMCRGYYGFCGRIRQAEKYHRVYEALIEKNKFDRYAFSAYQRTVMSEICFELNDLEGALQFAEKALATSRSIGVLGAFVPATIVKLRILSAKGKIGEALGTVRKAMNELQSSGGGQSIWFSQLSACEARLALQAGDEDAVGRWIGQCRLTEHKDLAINQDYEWLTFIRAKTAIGDIEEAFAWSEQLLKNASLHGRLMTELEAHICLAILYERKSMSHSSLLHLHQALVIGAREGYLRIFAEWEELFPLLAQYADVRKNKYMPELHSDVSLHYVGTIAATFGIHADADKSGPAAGYPAHSLTERETEVLQLLAAGLSNKEIAARLVLTEGTVKLHLNRIYSKLQVRGRVQAIQKAQELQLL